MSAATFNVYSRITRKPVAMDKTGKECAEIIGCSYFAFMRLAENGGNSSYRIVRTVRPVYGRIEPGEKIRMIPEFLKCDREFGNVLMDGTILWVHPERRFFVVDFGGIRECVHMTQLRI